MGLKQYKLAYIRRSIDESDFIAIYLKLLDEGSTLKDEERRYLLRIALVFMSFSDDEVVKFGYAIILRYANKTHDYVPLYDVSLARNYIPVAQTIASQGLVKNTDDLSRLAQESLTEGFKDEVGIYRSQGQMLLKRFSDANNNIVIVAPTSYGKSEMMIDKVRRSLSKKVCIVVPTKALVSQTKKKLIDTHGISARKIITHPDMYVEERDRQDGFIAVLTQERLIRLFTQNRNASLDILFVDEAHNLLRDEPRALMMAQCIIIATKRNPYIDISFFTPFLSDEHNVTVLGSNSPISQSIDEYMKIERFYYTYLETNDLLVYDQFMDKGIPVRRIKSRTASEFVIEESTNKNVVYLNKPKDVEVFASELMNIKERRDNDEYIARIIKAIKGYTHKDYGLIECIKRGVVYHHGGMPDIIKMYVESIYANTTISHLITTSTLLEGVNIPANRLFVLNTGVGDGVLNKAQFKNLVGRVGRFSEVFARGDGTLNLLEPRVYLLDDTKYSRKDLNPFKFYSSRVKVGISIKDKVENPLLQNSKKVTNRDDEVQYLANIEPGLSILDETKEYSYAKTEVGKLSFAYAIRDYDIISSEEVIQKRIDERRAVSGFIKIDNPDDLIGAIKSLFLEGVVSEDREISKRLFEFRLESYYSMFMGWFAEYNGYGYMISRLLYFWKDKRIVYVGKMGEIDKMGNPYAWFKKYARINTKTPNEKVNLAISVIKETQDYIDNCIVPYVDILNELEIIEDSLFNKIKYHTTDEKVILLIKYGLTFELSRILSTPEYGSLINISSERIEYDKDKIIAQMEVNDENEISVFEAKNYL